MVLDPLVAITTNHHVSSFPYSNASLRHVAIHVGWQVWGGWCSLHRSQSASLHPVVLLSSKVLTPFLLYQISPLIHQELVKPLWLAKLSVLLPSLWSFHSYICFVYICAIQLVPTNHMGLLCSWNVFGLEWYFGFIELKFVIKINFIVFFTFLNVATRNF